MKEVLLRVLGELRTGRNLPHHLSVAVAMGVPLAKMLGMLDNAEWHQVFIIVTLGLLMAKSIQNEWLFSKIQPKLSGNPIKVHALWSSESVRQVLHSARKSIVVFQTWVPDATELGDLIHQLAFAHASGPPLEVAVHMLDPDNLSGAYRVHQLDRVRQLEGERALFDDEREQRRYRESFLGAQKALIDRLANRVGVKLRIFTYDDLPALKLYVIDEQDFLFSWFGADGPSTQNVCLQVSMRSGSAEIDQLIEKLLAHRVAVQKGRKQIWPIPPEGENVALRSA